MIEFVAVELDEDNADSFENMRYSTFQGQEYGVALHQYRLPSETNEHMMAGIDAIESKNNSLLEEGSVVSNLPLLFANGHPTSLEKITLAQLERFVTFMVQCSLGHDTTDVITEPQWWPKEVKFSNPITRPKRTNDNWMANLKKLVFRCYTYHRSEYLLRFCSYLARYPQEDLEYVNNWDSTTSLYHKSTGKLLVTFRNENMNYDRRQDSPRKKLLSCNGVTSCYPNKSKQQQHSITMVEPQTDDIYLCDRCDAEFVGLEKMKEHERACCEREHSGHNSRPTTPDITVSEPELRQDQFLNYFHLCSIKPETKMVELNPGDTANNNNNNSSSNNNNNNNNSSITRTSRRVRGSISFTRCSTIPFSSPAGIILAKKSKAMTEETQQERLERIERHLIAPVLNNSSRPKWLEAEIDHDRWIVTFKPNREKQARDYVHEYKFVNSVKRKPMLSIQSQLLYVVCRPVYVLLTRLSSQQINDLKRDLPKYRCIVQNVSVDNTESMTENQKEIKTNTSSKRKAPSDENESTAAEENDKINYSEANIDQRQNVYECKDDCDGYNTTKVRSAKDTTLRSNSSESVTFIDLCSSDEEETVCDLTSKDKNRNPMSRMTENMTRSLLQKLSSSNFHLKPDIFQTEERKEWVSGNILADDRENYTNGYRSTILSAHANLSPILRPAP